MLIPLSYLGFCIVVSYCLLVVKPVKNAHTYTKCVVNSYLMYPCCCNE